jgi:hypothetical protein
MTALRKGRRRRLHRLDLASTNKIITTPSGTKLGTLLPNVLLSNGKSLLGKMDLESE